MPGWVLGKFSRRLAFAFVGILLAAFACLDALLSRSLKRQLIEGLTANLLTEARLLRMDLEDRPAPGPEGLQGLASSAGGGCACRVSVIGSDGRLLADSGVPPGELSKAENHRERPEVRAALQGGEGVAVRLSATVHEEFLYAALPFRRQGKVAGVLRLAAPLTDVRARIARQRGTLAVVSLWTLAAALLCALWLSGSISRPVEEMSRVADSLAKGDYEARLRLLPADEIGRLGRALNLLADRVRATISELSREKAQLSAVLSNMVEGVVAVDEGGRVLLVNAASARIFGVEPAAIQGRPFVEVLRHAQIAGFLEGALKEGSAREGEARLFAPEERVFEVHAMPMLSEGRRAGALAVLHDVTRLRRLEQVRRDFVANVSHELRTPLVSIKGFAETLRSGGIDDKAHRLEFLQTIEAEADRMSQLVDDLLQLSAMEAGQRPPRREEIDLLALAREVAESLKPLAERRRVSLAVAPGPVRVRADPAQMRQVLMNLLANAIRFNKEAGSVSVAARARAGALELSVVDTGVGIPPEDLPRVFERFYRVDKARTREQGGTGLGLAIVKHIVEAHGGSVSVESVEDEGSTFRVVLPAA